GSDTEPGRTTDRKDRPRHREYPWPRPDRRRVAGPGRVRHRRPRPRAGRRRRHRRRDRRARRGGHRRHRRPVAGRGRPPVGRADAGRRAATGHPREQRRHEHPGQLLGRLRRRLGLPDQRQLPLPVHPGPARRPAHDRARDPRPDRQHVDHRRPPLPHQRRGLRRGQGRRRDDDPQHGVRTRPARRHGQLRHPRRHPRPADQGTAGDLGRDHPPLHPARTGGLGRRHRQRRPLLLPARVRVDHGAVPDGRRRPLHQVVGVL
ncbi:MAG: 3-oxoacyl-[acyl-carrier protein] reductase, partial [uncultured Thermomicrobiales bacterium]